jgi:predicted TIM-barrel fold metal-dependent hydrolase
MTKEYLVVDTDIHPGAPAERMLDFLPEPWRTRYAGGNRAAGTLGYWNPGGVNRADAVLDDGLRIENDPRATAKYLLDAYQLDYGILNPGSSLHYGLSPEIDYAAVLISATNDVMVADWLTADPRYRLSIVVYPHVAEVAVREIERLGSHPGVVQIVMPSGSPTAYGHRSFHPIYAAAVKYDLPVAIHPGTEGVGISGAPTGTGYPASYLEWHTDLVGSYIGHLVSLVSEGVFAKFPTLKFVMLEGGVSWLPPICWRFDKNWKALRMTVPWVDRPPSEIIRDHVLLSTQPLEEPDTLRHLHTMLEMFDAEKMLMFATDYPHWDGDTPDFAARLLPAKLHKAVMGENARQLYKLPEQPRPIALNGAEREVAYA